MSDTPDRQRIEAIAERRDDVRKKTRNGLSKDFWDHYGPFLSSLCLDDVDAFLAERTSLQAEIERLQPYEDELHKIAEDVGEPDDPFAAWEAIEATKASLTQARELMREAGKYLEEMSVREVGNALESMTVCDACRASQYSGMAVLRHDDDCLVTKLRTAAAKQEGK